jgi:hypothetical protein
VIANLSGFTDDCKTNVQVSLFRANFESALYQGTTSVVPKRASRTRALAPAALFSLSVRLRQRSAAQPARRTLPLQHSMEAAEGAL